MGADPGGDATRPAAGKLLGQDGVVEVVTAATAQLARVLEAEVAALGEPAEHLVREPARSLPLLGVGTNLRGDELTDLGAQGLVRRRERRDRRAPGGRHPGSRGECCAINGHDRRTSRLICAGYVP